MQLSKEEIKISKDLGSPYYYLDLLNDLKKEPTEICNVDKRRKCDSYYIQMNSKLKKENIKLLEENKNLKMLLSVYQDVLTEVVDETSGKVVK